MGVGECEGEQGEEQEKKKAKTQGKETRNCERVSAERAKGRAAQDGKPKQFREISKSCCSENFVVH